ncbi:MAG TPA: outer membrane protein [Methylovirgula sp.]|nr:outer membrane protein [Methylovirgula sp.]
MIKKLLVASVAALGLTTGGVLAADLPNTKGPPVFAAPPPPPVFSWTGFYIGGQVGYQWGTTGWDLHSEPPAPFVAVGEPTYNDQGVVGGGHAGFNYQVAQFVFGVEGDIEGTSYRGTGVEAVLAPGLITNTTRIDIEGSVRGRIGWAWDRVLFYGTGGVAFADFKNGFNAPTAPFFDTATFGRVGWTAGGGVEYAIDPNWSVRVEYRYTDYGRYDFVIANPPVSGTIGVHEHERDNRVEAGFSYRFDMFSPPAPVVAKY